MRQPVRAVLFALLFAGSLSGMSATAGPCDHGVQTGGTHGYAAPDDQPPCGHEETDYPAAPCAAQIGCVSSPVAIVVEVVRIPEAPVVILAAAPGDLLSSVPPALDVPPPRL